MILSCWNLFTLHSSLNICKVEQLWQLNKSAITSGSAAYKCEANILTLSGCVAFKATCNVNLLLTDALGMCIVDLFRDKLNYVWWKIVCHDKSNILAIQVASSINLYVVFNVFFFGHPLQLKVGSLCKVSVAFLYRHPFSNYFTFIQLAVEHFVNTKI